MNGVQHYRRAEELLADAEQVGGSDRASVLAARAQAHAVLAMAAATAVQPAAYPPARREGEQWRQVAAVEADGAGRFAYTASPGEEVAR